MSNFLDLVQDFITKGCADNGTERDIEHFKRTLYWLLQLKSDSDEALQIAAFSHDAERVFRDANYQLISKSEKGFKDEKHLDYHQKTGADIISKYLAENGASEELTSKVSHLISKHEVGGDDDQNLLKDADSVSFFETNADYFLSNKVLETGVDKVKDKFDWMYGRITSPKAKDFCKDWYFDALKKLDAVSS